jgi:hypothetical protein
MAIATIASPASGHFSFMPCSRAWPVRAGRVSNPPPAPKLLEGGRRAAAGV